MNIKYSFLMGKLMSDNVKINKIIARCDLDKKKISFWRSFEAWKDIALMAASFYPYSFLINTFGVIYNTSITTERYYGGEFQFDDSFLRKNELKMYPKILLDDEQKYNMKYKFDRQKSNIIFHIACYLNTWLPNLFTNVFFKFILRVFLMCFAYIQIVNKYLDNYLDDRNNNLRNYVLITNE